MRIPLTRWLRVSLPVRVFLLGCVLTALAVTMVDEWSRMSTVRDVDETASSLENRLMARAAAYEALLRGAAGFFGTQAWIERTMFLRYVRQLDITENYAGMQGLGLTLRVAPEDLADFEAAARREIGPGFRVWPEGPRPEYHAILYLEPDDDRNRAAIGYDMHTEAMRRAAMDRARDTGHSAVTGRVTLVQEIRGVRQPGFLIYLPFYEGGVRPATEAERRETLAGFAYAAFRVGDFIASVATPSALRGMHLEVYDGTDRAPESRLFPIAAGSEAQPGGIIKRVHSVRVFERSWEFVYTAELDPPVPLLSVGLFGIAASAAAAYLLRGVMRARQRAEESEAVTRAREGELALLVDAVPALVTYFDRDGVIRICNRRYFEWFGEEAPTLIGRRIADVTGPALYAQLQPVLSRAYGGDVVSFEKWYNSAPGGARYLHTVFVPHRGPSGQVVGLYGLTSDLTAHKRAEEGARFMSDCGRLLISSMDYESGARGIVHLAVPRIADVAILFRAEQGELRAEAVAHVEEEASQRLARYFEGTRLPISGENNIAAAARSGMVVVTQRVQEADLDRAATNETQRQLLRALKLQSALHVPVVVRNQLWAVFSFGATAFSGRRYTDEHRKLAEEIATRMRLAVENARLFREAQQEVDERRRAERAAEQSEERYRLLVDGIRDYAIIGLDAEGRVDSWNEGAERTLGYGAAEAAGAPAARFFTADDRDADVPGRQRVIAAERGASSDERWFERKGGEPFWGSSHLAALRDDGGIRGYAWILRDVTERKRWEDELERRVQARTSELNEAVHELEAFSYSVSHDLRAPLRSIRGFTELALEEGGERLTEEQRGYLERVRRAAARLERLIADLLAYTRISKTKVELTRVDLHSLVGDLVREHPEFQPPHAQVEIQGRLAAVTGNEAYLTQCLTNLLGNAVKFVAPGRRPQVRLWTEHRERTVRLFVADNGIGIAPERASRAFEMFERLHTTGSYEGTGVGLAIVRRAVQRMNGTVGLESKVGEGTTFWIELPEADGAKAEPPAT